MTASHTAICPNCRSPLSGESRFCPQCGASVSGVSPSLAGDWAPAAVAPAAPASPWDSVLARLRQVTLGEFDVGRELGRGGMAAVFLAHDLALNRKVAIKVMSPGLLMGAGMIERFRQEAVTIANLQHAHIVTVHAVRQLEDLHFFVMQFIEGQSLEGVLRAHRVLPLELVRPIVYQMGTALAYAHRRGVIHRDVKPGNVLLSGEGDALVTDFGIAKVAAGPTQTATGMVVGTPSYMSPEQCHAEELDGKSDQYSLGIVAYQMLTGTVPFAGSTFAIMHGHTSQPVPLIRDLVPSVPASVEQAIVRMLAKKASDRFATLAEALQALEARPVGEDAPERTALARLAAVEERRVELGELLRTPGSPVPRSRAVPVLPQAQPQAISIDITPVGHPLESGEQAMLRATVRGPADVATLRWSSDHPAVATVQAETGAVLALAPGTALVRASIGGVSAELQLPVAAPRATFVRISPASITMRAGEQLVVTAVVSDRRGAPVPRPVSWSVRGEAAHVDALGTVTALMSGSATVTATCDGVQESVAVEVRPIVAAADGLPPVGDSVTRLMSAAAFAPHVEPPPMATPAQVPASPQGAATLLERTVASPAAPAPAQAPVVPAPGGPRRVAGLAIVGGVLAVAAGGWFVMRGVADISPSARGRTQPASDAVAPTGSTLDPITRAAPESTVAPTAVTTSGAGPVAASSRNSATAVVPTLVLRVIQPSSRELRVGQTLRLRASLEDSATRATVAGPIRFGASDRRIALVNPRTGLVTAVAAGAVSIVVEGGAAGTSRIDLVVRAAPTRQVVVGPVLTPSVTPGTVVTPPIVNKIPPSSNQPQSDHPRTATPAAAVGVSQAQLAAEARTVVVSFARAIESRDMGVVKALFPGISAQYASDLTEMFEASKSVRVSVNTVAVRGGGVYDATPGTRTSIAASVTFRFVPVRGNPTSSDDTWPMTLQREATGWRVVQVSSQ